VDVEKLGSLNNSKIGLRGKEEGFREGRSSWGILPTERDMQKRSTEHRRDGLLTLQKERTIRMAASMPSVKGKRGPRGEESQGPSEC